MLTRCPARSRRRRPARGSLLQAAGVGMLAGLVSGMVKIGWEAALPPRTPERDDPNPPMHLLEQLGIPAEVREATVTFNENQVPVTGLAVHPACSVAMAVPYCVAARRCPAITAGGGAVYGLGVWAGFHLGLLPALGTVPAATEQPWQEHMSEAAGHVVWAWSIEAVRRALAPTTR